MMFQRIEKSVLRLSQASDVNVIRNEKIEIKRLNRKLLLDLGATSKVYTFDELEVDCFND